MNHTDTRNDTLLTTSDLTTTTTSHSGGGPFLCVDAGIIMDYAIMASAMVLFIAILVIVLCLICRQRARRDQYYTERLKAQLRTQHEAESLKLEEDHEQKQENEDEDEELVGMALHATADFQKKQHSDYSALQDAV